MAILNRDPSTIPAIKRPQPFGANEETDEGAIRGALEALHSTVVQVVERLNGLLSIGDGVHASWTGNLDGQWIRNVVFSGAVDVAVPHGLGRIPVAVIPVITQFVPGDAVSLPNVIADSTKSWTQDMVYLSKRNAGQATVSFLVF